MDCSPGQGGDITSGVQWRCTNHPALTLKTCWVHVKETAVSSKILTQMDSLLSLENLISKCINYVIISKTITTHAIQKLWMTAEVHMLQRTPDPTFRWGNKSPLRTAKAKLLLAIKEAMCAHACDGEDSLPDVLNYVCTQHNTIIPKCFKTTTSSPSQRSTSITIILLHSHTSPWSASRGLWGSWGPERAVPSLDPMQFAYHPYHSTDDAIYTPLSLPPTHLDKRTLLIDFSLTVPWMDACASHHLADTAGSDHIPL